MTNTTLQNTDFKSFISSHKARIYEKICQYLPIKGEREYDDMIRVYVDRQGQYRRPSYVLLWTLLYGGNIDDAILPAAAQQVSEDWILMQDDWMDGNELRRRETSAHKLFAEKYAKKTNNPSHTGNIYAINASDSLHILNWKMAKDASDQLGNIRGNKYFEKFNDILLTTCNGQYLDTKLSSEKDITKFTDEDYFKSIHAKSAYYSVYGPMQCGAMIAGSSDEIISNICQYGVPAGYAFQIRDDILDCTSSEQELGKSIGNDIRSAAKTLILLHAVQNAPATTLTKMKEIYSKPREHKTESDVQYIMDKFNELGSIKWAEKEAVEYAQMAKNTFDIITSDLPESNLKNLARDSIIHSSERKN